MVTVPYPWVLIHEIAPSFRLYCFCGDCGQKIFNLAQPVLFRNCLSRPKFQFYTSSFTSQKHQLSLLASLSTFALAAVYLMVSEVHKLLFVFKTSQLMMMSDEVCTSVYCQRFLARFELGPACSSSLPYTES